MRKGFKLPKTKPLEKPYHKANDVMNDLSRMHNVAKIKNKQLTLQDKFKLVEKVKIKRGQEWHILIKFFWPKRPENLVIDNL